MSDQKCFTVIWAIENFSIYSDKKFLKLEFPSWHLADEGKELFYLTAHVTALEVIFQLYPTTAPTFTNWDVSLISSCGTISLKREFFGCFSINKKDIFGDNPLVLPSNTLTVCCKYLKVCTNIRELRFCSVLHRIRFPWTIENFSVLDKTSHETSWEKDILFHINEVGTGKRTHTVTVRIEPSKGVFEFHLLDFKFFVKSGSLFSISNVYHHRDHRTWKANFSISNLYDCAKDLPLIIECIFAVNKDKTTTTSSSNSIKTLTAYSTSESVKTNSPIEAVQDSTGTLTSDFLSLLRDSTLSDATLNTEGKSFSAHKNILSARSSVFKAMFEKEDTTEGRSGIVDIEDIDSETVQRLLVFLYGELFEDLQWDDASKLYYAADKYDVLLLKQKCSNILKAGLSVSNACAAIILAARHSDDELMKSAVDYVRDHQEVMSSSDWEKLEESDPRLAAKILRQVFIKKGKS